MIPSPGQLIRSILTLGAGQVVTWIGSAALAVFLPRLLGDANLGKVAFAFALVHLIGLVADLGSATYLTREIARNPDNAARLTLSALLLKVPLSLVAILVVIAVVQFGSFDDVTRRVVLVMSGSILLESLTSVILAALQGVHEMRTLAISSTVSKMLYAILAVLALMSGAGPTIVASAAVSSLLVGLMIAVLALRRRMPLTFKLSTALWKTIVLGGLPFFVWQAAHAIYGEIDMVLLAILTRDSVVGWYAAAYRIVTIPAFVSTIVTTVMLPVLSAAASQHDRFNIIARRAVHYVTLLTLPMGIGIMALAPQIISMFSYPPSFDNSIVPIAVLAPHLPMAATGTILGTVLTARDRQRAWALSGVGAALLNPLMNLMAIPLAERAFGNGAIGAAIATTLTEVYLLSMAIALMPRGIFSRQSVVNFARCLGAAAIMIGPVWLVRDLPIVVPVAVGALTYVGASFAFGTLAVADLRELCSQMIRPRAHSGVPSPVGGTS